MERFERSTIRSFRNVKNDMETIKKQIEELHQEQKELLSLIIEMKSVVKKKRR